MSEDASRIVDITLDEQSMVRRSPQVEHERKVAIYDLLEENLFQPKEHDGGPYHLRLGIEENRLVFDVRTTNGEPACHFSLPIATFRKVVKDYFMICESYYSAIKTASPSKIEAIDMGRRGLHNEGAAILKERLEEKVELDMPTSRRLFTLVCVLHIRS